MLCYVGLILRRDRGSVDGVNTHPPNRHKRKEGVTVGDARTRWDCGEGHHIVIHPN